MIGEKIGRAYCDLIGEIADELVAGWSRDKWGYLQRYVMPRWKWYMNADLNAYR